MTNGALELSLHIELGAGLHLRTLTGQDLDPLVEATRGGSARSLWGGHPRRP